MRRRPDAGDAGAAAPQRATWLVRLALRAWPARLRGAAASELAAMHGERAAEARARGNEAHVRRVTSRDALSIAGAGLRARFAARPAVGGALDDALGRGGGSGGFGGLRADVRYAWRGLQRRPRPAVLALVTAGLGIGAATAMFSVVDAVLLRPLPYPEPHRIVSVHPTIEEWRDDPTLAAGWERGLFSQPEYEDWTAAQTSFVATAPVTRRTAILLGPGDAVQLEVGITTPDLFTLLGIVPQLGRLIDPGEADAGETPLLLTHQTWASRFGRDDEVLGRVVSLDGVPHVVVGVLPAYFRDSGLAAEVWTVLPRARESGRNVHSLSVIGRLADGVSVARAEAETDALLRGMSGGDHGLTHGARVVPRLEDQTRRVRAPLLLLLGAAAVLLLAACVSVAGLRLGAGLDRATELNVRAALGASRGRIARQLFAENLLLALAGGVAGLVLAHWLTRLLIGLAPADLPRVTNVAIDARVIASALGVTVLFGLVFGTVPAWLLAPRQSDVSLTSPRMTRPRRQGLHGALIVLQVALAALLLSGAALLARTMAALRGEDPGFDTHAVVAVSLGWQWGRFTGPDAGARSEAYLDELAAALAAVHGVEAVSIASEVPLTGGRGTNAVEPEDYDPLPDELLSAERYIVSGNYFDVLGLRLRAGRALTMADDRPGAASVAVVSERFVRRFWPGESGVGRRFAFWGNTVEIVGVVADVRDRTLAGDDGIRFYVPRAQLPGSGSHFLVRSARPPDALLPELRRALRRADPQVPVTRLQPLAEITHGSLAEERFRAYLVSAFALFAAAFSALGIYGVVSRSVASRRAELGLRLALGAAPAAIVAGVLRQGVTLAAAGCALGLAAAFAATRVLAAFLYGLEPGDPLTLAAVALALGGVAALVSLAPSISAARTDPMVALKSE